jgi:hypothetical protein
MTLSTLTFRPSTPVAGQPVLLFLHGIGEAFRNENIRSSGIRHLLRQGVPRLLLHPEEALEAEHPLMRGAFAVVAPQLPDRETPWHQPGHVGQIRRAIDAVGPEADRKLYIVGFSKGGRAAFQFAGDLQPRAIVSIDASPMSKDPAVIRQVAAELSQCRVPFWAIHTTYPKDHRLERIPQMHGLLAVDAHGAGSWDSLAAPAAGARCRSAVVMDHRPADERHGALCTAVTRARAPFEWLLQH